MKKFVLAILLLTGFYASAQPIPNYVPTAGLKAYYGFSGDAHDWTGTTANNGTYNVDVSPIPDRMSNANSAFHFTGEPSPGHLNLPANSNLNFAGDFSLSFWVRTDSIYCTLSRTDIIGSNDYGVVPNVIHGFEISAYNNDGRINFISWDGGVSYHNTTVNGGNITTGLWIHIACVSQGTQHTIYKNGVLIATATGPAMAASQYHVYMGYNPYQCGHLNGDLDDVGIWNRALNQAEVTALYTGVPVGIRETVIEKGFLVYPNPASTFLTIKTDAALISSHYKIIDFTGREVLNGIIQSTHTVVDIDQLATGNYTIQVDEKFRQTLTIGKK